MALSGSFGTDFSGNQYGGGYRLQVDWYATQNIATNQSTVRADLYLISKGSSWTINSSASKGVSLNIDGNYSGGNVAGIASLSGNQKKQIWWHQVTVNHNADGSKSLDLVGILDIAVTLSGQYYDTVRTSQTITLDTIPRASTISTQPDITAGRPHAFTIQRASSEFTHTVSFHIVESNGTETQVGLLYDQGASGTFNFNDAEVYTMYQKLNKASTIKTRIKCTTLRYGTIIGSTQRDGTCYNWNGGYATFAGVANYGDSISVTINNGHPNMRYDTEFRWNTTPNSGGSGGTSIKTQSNMLQGVTNVTFSVTDVNNMLSATPTVTACTCTAKVTTYWVRSSDGARIQIANPITSDFWANGGNKIKPPVFTGAFTYADTNTTVVNVTANDQYIVQNMSTVRVTLPTASQASPAVNSGTTMKEYTVYLGGKQITQAFSSTATLTFDIGTVDAVNNLTLEIKAIDNRGQYTSQFKTVNILPYSKPSLASTVSRVNNFENTTELTASGTFSPLTINGVNKNNITMLRYRFKKTIGESWDTVTTYYNFTTSMSGTTFTGAKLTRDLDNSFGYSFEITVRDVFGLSSQVIVNRTIEKGKPLFFIDYEKATVGIGKFPENGANGLEVVGKLEADGIKTTQGVFQLSSVLKQQGNGATEFAYTANNTQLTIYGRNFTTNTTHDIAMSVQGTATFKQWWAWNVGGIYLDGFGNINGQASGGSDATFSIKDADNRIRYLTSIGKGGTLPNEYRSYTNGHDFYHDGRKFLSLYTHESYSGRCIQFGADGGILKWYVNYNNFQGRLEARNSNNTNWCELAGNLNNASSREYKDNIKVFEGNAMEIINSAVGNTYTYKDDESKTLKVGLIAEDAPEIIVGAGGDTVDSYGMATLSWIGLQEHDVEIKYLHQEITELKKEIQILKTNKGEM
ncbi:pyocin family protein [Bacillus phage vB_BanS-Thrax5]|nr:pyocin family protein [Bacillus phage vB_BanS-Thrax5]